MIRGRLMPAPYQCSVGINQMSRTGSCTDQDRLLGHINEEEK